MQIFFFGSARPILSGFLYRPLPVGIFIWTLKQCFPKNSNKSSNVGGNPQDRILICSILSRFLDINQFKNLPFLGIVTGTGKYCGLAWGCGTGWRIHTPTKPVPASRVFQIYFIFNFFVHIYIYLLVNITKFRAWVVFVTCHHHKFHAGSVNCI